MAQPSRVTSKSVSARNVGTSISATWPGGAPAAGLFMVATVVLNPGTVTAADVQGPAGWTLDNVEVQRLTSVLVAVFRKFSGGAEAASPSFAFVAEGTATPQTCDAVVFLDAYQDVDAASPIFARGETSGSATAVSSGTATGAAGKLARAVIGSANAVADQSGFTGGFTLVATQESATTGTTTIHATRHEKALTAAAVEEVTASVGATARAFAGKLLILNGTTTGSTDTGLFDEDFPTDQTSGWGADWTVSDPADFSVSSGKGVTSPPAGSSGRRAARDVGQRDVDETWILDTSKLAVGGSQQYTVCVRANVGLTTYYGVKVTKGTDGTISWRVRKVVNSVETVLGAGAVTEAFSDAAGQQLSIRFRAVGTNPTTLEAKVWRTADAQPGAWEVSIPDTDAALQAGSGTFVGSIAFLQSTVTNVPVLFRVDRVTVVAPGASTGGSVTRTPVDNAYTTAAAPVPLAVAAPPRVGVGYRMSGDSTSSRTAWDNIQSSYGLEMGYMGLMVRWAHIQPDRSTLQMYATTPGTGVEDGIRHAHENGYVVGLRMMAGKDAPAWIFQDTVAGSAVDALQSAVAAGDTLVTVVDRSDFPVDGTFEVQVDAEVMRVTAGQSGRTWTVTRGIRGTTAAAHSAGAAIRHVHNGCLPLDLVQADSGAAITVPLWWDIPSSSSSPHAPSWSGTNLRYHYRRLMERIAAWLDQVDTWTRNSVTYSVRRGDVVDSVTISMPTEAGTEMTMGYGGYAQNKTEWLSVSPASGTTDDAKTAANRAATVQAWKDAIAIHYATIGAVGVSSSIAWGHIFVDNHAGALEIIAAIGPGGALNYTVGKMVALRTDLRPANDGSGHVKFYDADATLRCSAANEGVQTYRCWASIAHDTMTASRTAGMRTTLQSAQKSVYDAFAGAGKDGYSFAFRAAMTDGAQTYHARWLEVGGDMIAPDAAWIRGTLQPMIQQVAVNDGYTGPGGDSGGGPGGGGGGAFSDDVAAAFLPIGVRTVERGLGDTALATGGDIDVLGFTIVRNPEVPVVDVAQGTWTLVLTDLEGNQLGEAGGQLRSLDRSLTRQLGGPASLSGRQSAGDPMASLIRTGETKVKAYRNGILRFHGTIWQRRVVWDEDTWSVEWVAFDPLQYLLVAYADGRFGQSAVNYPAQDAHWIIHRTVQQWRAVSGVWGAPSPLRMGELPTNSAERARTFDPGTRALEAMQTLQGEGVEFVCRPTEGTFDVVDETTWFEDGTMATPGGRRRVEVQGLLDVYSGRKGGVTGAVFARGGGAVSAGIVSGEHQEDLMALVTDALATPQTSGGGNEDVGGVWRQSAMHYRFGYFPRATQFQNVRAGGGRLKRLAQRLVSPGLPYAVTFQPGAEAPRLFRDYDVGDTVTTQIIVGPVMLARRMRALASELQIDDDGVEHPGALAVGELDLGE